MKKLTKRQINEAIREAYILLGHKPTDDMQHMASIVAPRFGVKYYSRQQLVERATRRRIANAVRGIKEPAPKMVAKPTPVLVVVKKEDRPQQKKIDAFYDSWDWKRLRYDFIKDRERRCECCGATPDGVVRIVVDHIQPIRKYWSRRLDKTNLQLLCDDCNMGKGSRDETDWRAA